MVKHCMSGPSGPACISPGFTIRIAAWHSSLVTSPYQYLRHGGSWATQRHQSWKIRHVFKRPFDTIWCCVMKWNIISMEIHGNFFVRGQIELSEIFSKRRRHTFPTRNRQFCNPELTCWSTPGRWFVYEKWTHPSRTTNPWWGFRFSVRVYFDVFSIYCSFSH